MAEKVVFHFEFKVVNGIFQTDYIYRKSPCSHARQALKIVGKFRRINEKRKEGGQMAHYRPERHVSNVFPQGRLLKLVPGLLSVVLHKVVDDALFEAEFDGDVLAEKDLAFEDILVGKDQVYA